MDQETLNAVKQEMTKVAEGMMDAMTTLALLIYASGEITKDELVKIACDATAAPGMSPIGTQLLRGMCARLEAWKGDLPRASTKH